QADGNTDQGVVGDDLRAVPAVGSQVTPEVGKVRELIGPQSGLLALQRRPLRVAGAVRLRRPGGPGLGTLLTLTEDGLDGRRQRLAPCPYAGVGGDHGPGPRRCHTNSLIMRSAEAL